jgi:hypothetical protein
MSGTDKWKLFVIGKRAKPQCSKGISMNSLPVLYYANKNAWMKYDEILKKSLMNWNVELKRKSKKILQVRDNYVARPYLDF